MRTRRSLVTLGVCSLAIFMSVAASASPEMKAFGANRPGAEAREAPSRVDGDLPTNRPIVATVVEVDEDAGRVTLDTAHGQVALEISDDLAQRLSPGDVVVLRLTDDDDEDFPSASPRGEEPAPAEGAQKL